MNVTFVEPEILSFGQWSFGNRLLQFFLNDSPAVEYFSLHSISDSDFDEVEADMISETSISEVFSRGSFKLRHLKLKLSGIFIEVQKLISLIIPNSPNIETITCS